MSAYRTPGEVDEGEEGKAVERDPFAVEKFFIAGVVAAIAILAGAVVAYHHIDSHSPCREGKVVGYSACPSGARAELTKDGETMCRCTAEVRP